MLKDEMIKEGDMVLIENIIFLYYDDEDEEEKELIGKRSIRLFIDFFYVKVG